MSTLEGVATIARWQASRDGSTYTEWLETWAEAADAEAEHAPADDERNRRWIELRGKAPMQSKGKPVEDPAHLPLFIAANEPSLF